MSHTRLLSHRPTLTRLLGSLLCAVLLAATCLLALGQSAAAAPRRAQTTCSSGLRSVYVHTATAANSIGDWTDLDNSNTNGCPQATVVVTATFTPGGVYDNHPLGVWYDASRAKWAIFHEDQTPVPLFATYNVNAGSSGLPVYSVTVTATAANLVVGLLATGLGGSSNVPMVTPNWNPGGFGGVYDHHVLGVLWGPNPGQWYIYHQDATPIPLGASYNVWQYDYQPYQMVQTATTSNSSGDLTIINDPLLNNRPWAYVWVIGLSGTVGYDNHVLGVWYDWGSWTIFHEDGTPIPVGASYVVVFES